MPKTEPNPEWSYALISGMFLGIMSGVETPEDLTSRFDKLKELQEQALDFYLNSKQENFRAAAKLGDPL